MKALTLGLALALALPGCAGRAILHVEDGPGVDAARTTIVTTSETKFYGIFAINKIGFWECADRDGSLHCNKSCDIKDDTGERLACPILTPMP